MHIILNSQSMIPIYEQLVDQIRKMILEGSLPPDTPLPSVRTMASDLKISALTVKKSYDRLEEEGYVATVHGKGTYVKGASPELLMEERRKEVENLFEKAIEKAEISGMSKEEILSIIDILLGE